MVLMVATCHVSRAIFVCHQSNGYVCTYIGFNLRVLHILNFHYIAYCIQVNYRETLHIKYFLVNYFYFYFYFIYALNGTMMKLQKQDLETK